MELPQDLKDFRAEDDSDSFQLISGEAAVYLMVVVGFIVVAFRGYL